MIRHYASAIALEYFAEPISCIGQGREAMQTLRRASPWLFADYRPLSPRQPMPAEGAAANREPPHAAADDATPGQRQLADIAGCLLFTIGHWPLYWPRYAI